MDLPSSFNWYVYNVYFIYLYSENGLDPNDSVTSNEKGMEKVVKINLICVLQLFCLWNYCVWFWFCIPSAEGRKLYSTVQYTTLDYTVHKVLVWLCVSDSNKFLFMFIWIQIIFWNSFVVLRWFQIQTNRSPSCAWMRISVTAIVGR